MLVYKYMRIATIYMITNKKNGKVYVGQTWESMEERFRKHKWKATHNANGAKALNNAIRKYGVDAFKVEKLDEATTQQEADILEDFYILASRTHNKGYNIKRGGSRGKHSEKSKEKISASKLGKKRPRWVVEKMMRTKRREKTHQGEKHGRAILREKDVRDIRRVYDYVKKKGEHYGMLSALARQYKVSVNLIDAIVKRRLWKHVK